MRVDKWHIHIYYEGGPRDVQDVTICDQPLKSTRVEEYVHLMLLMVRIWTPNE